MDSEIIIKKLDSLRGGLENARRVVHGLRAELSDMDKNIIATEGAISVLEELLGNEKAQINNDSNESKS